MRLGDLPGVDNYSELLPHRDRVIAEYAGAALREYNARNRGFGMMIIPTIARSTKLLFGLRTATHF